MLMKKAHTALRRRPLLTPIWLTAFVALIFVAVLAGFVASMTTTTVVIVRHAEKELGTIEDPPLTAAGEQRAEQLARMLGERGEPGRIAAIFASDTRRARQTAAPLAARLGLQVRTTAADDIDGLVRGIRSEFRGRNVLVVAHSNTVPDIVRSLAGLEELAPMPDSEYATMYVVTVPTIGTASVLRLRY